MTSSGISVQAHQLQTLAPAAAAALAAAGEGALLSVHTGFASLQADWRAMQGACRSYVFQSYDWLQAWYQHLGQRQGWQLRLVALSAADGRLLMLLPLGIRRQHGLRVLSFLGGEVTDYHAPLLSEDFPLQAFPVLWQAVAALLRSDADLLRVRRVPQYLEGGPQRVNPLIWLDGMAPAEQAHAATLTSSFAEFQKLRSSRLFADTRRKLRRLSELGTVQMLVDASVPQRADVVAAMARQKVRRWQASGSRNLFAEPGYLDFYQGLAAQGLEGGEVWVSALCVDATLVATHWGVRYGQRFYWLMPGYEDGEWGRYSAGRILMEALVQHGIAQKLEIFDLTVGDEAYKMQWADHTLALYSGQQAFNWRGQLAIRVGRGWQHLRERARSNRHLRNLVRRLRGREPIADAAAE